MLAELGRRVRARRIARGFTLKDMAARAGLSQRFLAQVEAGAGNLSVRSLVALAQAIGTGPAALLDREAGTAPPAIALLGLRGAGKTTIGKRLAKRLGWAFVELDRRVEQAAGVSVAEIFDLHGPAYFRRLERSVLEETLAEHQPLVLATGGGLVTSEESYELLRRRATTVWLRAAAEDHWSRVVRQGDRRPMSDRPEAMVELRRLLATREPLYAQAHVAFDTSRLGIDGTVEAIAKELAQSSTVTREAARKRPRERRHRP